jgi:putative aldouronate transport system permease protein
MFLIFCRYQGAIIMIQLPKYRWKDFTRNRWLYFLLIPGVVYFVIFRYIPIFGLHIAFMDYNQYNPAASKWVGFAQFIKLFSRNSFVPVLLNTLKISLLKLFCGFPIPIILALLMNEMRIFGFKKVVQTLLYLPHFISWVIMAGILMNLLDPSMGLITQLFRIGTDQNLVIMSDKKLFVPMLIVSDIYKNMGWGTIVYFAAMSGIDPQYYEAAVMDGAGKLRQALSITVPTILPTIVIMFILSCGNILNAGFEQIFMLYSPQVYEVADVIDTYVYRMGIIRNDYAFSTAAGMFKSVVALILILSVNQIARATENQGIF